MHKFYVTTLDQKPHLEKQIDLISEQAWPEFLLHGDSKNWHNLFDIFAKYQILFLDGPEKVAAVGHTVPLTWDGTKADLPETNDLIIQRAILSYDRKQSPNTFSAMAAMVDPEYRKQGLSEAILTEMRKLALHYGAGCLIAPVRPITKEKYLQIPFDDYVNKRREDGTALDPWIRVHERLGAKIAGTIPRGLTVTGTIEEWQKWTHRRFKKSGDYEIPGALDWVHIDIEHDKGVYYDPNVWMVHKIG